MALAILQNAKRAVTGFLLGPVAYLGFVLLIGAILKMRRHQHPWPFGIWVSTLLSVIGVLLLSWLPPFGLY
ncbi:hypothetical protein [Asticcacaulis sp. YBE204]|uniref:hypothetical protein n=1 Tax=Asticcacaulis sp. YBE204 TaxID=1282363 RepID=UPI0003C40CBA|nr:hypothetical protein [Asticcacaulis sp. YBE204]ESQ77819.1 hypothetical protein AEYBE204_16955 [Asticcacaulis sp. YBE204]